MTKKIEKFLWLSKEKKVISCDETNKVLNENYSEIKNEVYEFVRTRIGEPGEDVQKDDWVGIKDLSVGSLIMIYGKTKLRGEILEVLEITNKEMEKYTTYEEIIDVFG